MTDIVEVLTPPNSFSDTATAIVSAGEMRDAVAEITSLRAENERLRAVVKLFACDCAENDLCKFPHACSHYIARAALAAQPAPGGKDE